MRHHSPGANLARGVADPINVSGCGLDRAWYVIPVEFGWGSFQLGFSLNAVPVVDLIRRAAFFRKCKEVIPVKQ